MSNGVFYSTTTQPDHVHLDEQNASKLPVQNLKGQSNGQSTCNKCIEAIYCCTLCANCFNTWCTCFQICANCCRN